MISVSPDKKPQSLRGILFTRHEVTVSRPWTSASFTNPTLPVTSSKPRTCNRRSLDAPADSKCGSPSVTTYSRVSLTCLPLKISRMRLKAEGRGEKQSTGPEKERIWLQPRKLNCLTLELAALRSLFYRFSPKGVIG